jgi:CBS domain-containing protein
MADTRKQPSQSEAGIPDADAAQRTMGTAAAAGPVAGDVARRAGGLGAQAGEQGGRAASEALRRTGKVGAEAIRQTSEAAAETTRRGTQLATEAQYRFIDDAANQIREVGLKLAHSMQQSAEDVRLLVPQPALAGDGLRETQQALTTLIEATSRAGVRVAQEVIRLANPSALIGLQQRFVREYLCALAEGQADLLRAARQTTEQALRPIERQLELRRRGRSESERSESWARERARVSDVMSRDVRVASPEDTVQQATRLMREEDVGVLPVGQEDRLVGMVTDRDVALRLVAEGRDPVRTRVREVMTPEVRYVFEDENLNSAAEIMAEQQVRRLPVVNRAKRLVGVVTLGDLASGHRDPALAGRALAGVAQETDLHNQVAAE